MTDDERRLLEHMLAGDDPWLGALQVQARRARVVAGQGCGCATSLEIAWTGAIRAALPDVATLGPASIRGA